MIEGDLPRRRRRQATERSGGFKRHHEGLAVRASRPCRNLASLRMLEASEEGCWDRNVGTDWVITNFDQGDTASEAREVAVHSRSHLGADPIPEARGIHHRLKR